MLPHDGEPLPAAATTRMPTARTFATVCRIESTSQSAPFGGGPTGQPQELLMMFGAFDGSGVPPARFLGAMNHSKHSMYVLGRPTPRSMLRHAIHFAPGATPTW